METLDAAIRERPSHIPAELVFDFDMFNIPGAAADVQAAYLEIQRSSSDIFWTPRNGGHWVATRADDIEAIQWDTARFSHRKVTLPEMPDHRPSLIPLELEPPRHAHFRRPLVMALSRSTVDRMEADIRKIAVDAIEHFIPLGECEFVKDFGQILPINVFLNLVKLPLEDKDELLPLTEMATRGRDLETQMLAYEKLGVYLRGWIAERRAFPGDDLLSEIVNLKVMGDRISLEEASRFASMILFGGLDTVTATMGFIARFLAENPLHRRLLVDHLDNQEFLRNAIEELLRRYGVANTARYIARDFKYRGVSFRKGDMLLPPNPLVGLDERRVPDPLTVDFTRSKPPHAVFGNGAHACPGAMLARREFRIFLEEWLRRIPDFEVKPGTTPQLACGLVSGVLRLELSWPPTIS